jgi:hypothetical protein
MPLRCELSDLKGRLQGELFPMLVQEIGPLTDKARQFVTVLEMVRVEAHLPYVHGTVGRPPEDRAPLARAFIAMAVYAIPSRTALIERLGSDPTLRRLCGWSRPGDVAGEWTFSRAFAEFAESGLPARMHEAMIKAAYGDHIIGHVARDATAIEAREKPQHIEPAKRCRRKLKPKRGEPGWEELNRLDRQREMTHAEMMADLPRHCSVGVKIDAKGRKQRWTGYKLHLDVGDGDVPLAGILTSASLHDSQAAIPLAKITSSRVTHCYELMDTAYAAAQIRDDARDRGRVAIVPEQPQRGCKEEAVAEALARRNIRMPTAEDVRYRERTCVERVNGRLKDEFGGRFIRVRGHLKVMCHLMFGLLALTVDQLMRLTI